MYAVPPVALLGLLVRRWRRRALRALLLWTHALVAWTALIGFAALHVEELAAHDRSVDLWMWLLFAWSVAAALLPFGFALRAPFPASSTPPGSRWESAFRLQPADEASLLGETIERWVSRQPSARTLGRGFLVLDPTAEDRSGLEPILRSINGALALIPERDDRSWMLVYRRIAPSSWGIARAVWRWSVNAQVRLLADPWGARTEKLERAPIPAEVEQALDEAARLAWDLQRPAFARADAVAIVASGSGTTLLALPLLVRLFPQADGALRGTAALLAGMLASAMLLAAASTYRTRLGFRAYRAGLARPPAARVTQLLRARPMLLLLAAGGALGVAATIGWATTSGAPSGTIGVLLVGLVAPVLLAMWLGARTADRAPLESPPHSDARQDGGCRDRPARFGDRHDAGYS
ncbi:MAG: hypothetical protein NZ761_03605 [Dehalococcoidia bacterium]|nr:hypothetical protein [Dehalococcoidia bacterium]